MGSCVFRCDVTAVHDRTLTITVTVADGQSVAGMGFSGIPRSRAFGLQWLVETTWSARAAVDPRLQEFAASDPGDADLHAAAERFVERVEVGDPHGFPIAEPGWRYNEQVEIGNIEPARFTATVVVTDPALIAHLAPGRGWDSPCAMFE